MGRRRRSNLRTSFFSRFSRSSGSAPADASTAVREVCFSRSLTSCSSCRFAIVHEIGSKRSETAAIKGPR